MSPGRLQVLDARIVDGSGAPAFPGSVVVEGDRIAEVSRGDAPSDRADARVIDAGGRILSPGFIDVHNHSDVVPFVEPWMDSALRQGSTTLVVGNCGASPWPPAGTPELASLTGVSPEDLGPAWTTFGEYLERVEEFHLGLPGDAGEGGTPDRPRRCAIRRRSDPAADRGG